MRGLTAKMSNRTLHFVWVGDEPQPMEQINSWALHNIATTTPRCQIKIWGDMEYNGKTPDSSGTSEVPIEWPLKHRMDQMRATGQLCGVADLMRYQILYEHGGITLDADSVCERPIPQWIWDIPNALCHENEVARPGLLALGFMKFKWRKHPFLAYLIDQIDRIGWQDGLPAWQAVGPQRLTDEYRKWVRMFNGNDIMILPSALFIPNHFSGLEYRGEGAICKQEWRSTRNG